MSDCEEDFGDFPIRTQRNIKKKSSVGAYRAESTLQYTAGSGITTKNPPLFDGSTSCLKYEELIGDWLDLTVPEDTRCVGSRIRQLSPSPFLAKYAVLLLPSRSAGGSVGD